MSVQRTCVHAALPRPVTEDIKTHVAPYIAAMPDTHDHISPTGPFVPLAVSLPAQDCPWQVMRGCRHSHALLTKLFTAKAASNGVEHLLVTSLPFLASGINGSSYHLLVTTGFGGAVHHTGMLAQGLARMTHSWLPCASTLAFSDLHCWELLDWYTASGWQVSAGEASTLCRRTRSVRPLAGGWAWDPADLFPPQRACVNAAPSVADVCAQIAARAEQAIWRLNGELAPALHNIMSFVNQSYPYHELMRTGRMTSSEVNLAALVTQKPGLLRHAMRATTEPSASATDPSLVCATDIISRLMRTVLSLGEASSAASWAPGVTPPWYAPLVAACPVQPCSGSASWSSPYSGSGSTRASSMPQACLSRSHPWSGREHAVRVQGAVLLANNVLQAPMDLVPNMFCALMAAWHHEGIAAMCAALDDMSSVVHDVAVRLYCSTQSNDFALLHAIKGTFAASHLLHLYLRAAAGPAGAQAERSYWSRGDIGIAAGCNAAAGAGLLGWGTPSAALSVDSLSEIFAGSAEEQGQQAQPERTTTAAVLTQVVKQSPDLRAAPAHVQRGAWVCSHMLVNLLTCVTTTYATKEAPELVMGWGTKLDLQCARIVSLLNKRTLWARIVESATSECDGHSSALAWVCGAAIRNLTSGKAPTAWDFEPIQPVLVSDMTHRLAGKLPSTALPFLVAAGMRTGVIPQAMLSL